MKQTFRLSYFIVAFLWCSFIACLLLVIGCNIFAEEILRSHGEHSIFLSFWIMPNEKLLWLMPLGISAIASGLWAIRQQARDEAKSRHYGGLTIERWK